MKTKVLLATVAVAFSIALTSCGNKKAANADATASDSCCAAKSELVCDSVKACCAADSAACANAECANADCAKAGCDKSACAEKCPKADCAKADCAKTDCAKAKQCPKAGDKTDCGDKPCNR